jgi:hypothetical protein
MDDAKQQLIERLKTANNVLVTVSRNPSVDQLASCIGLSLLLNKQAKHAAAVFSGEVPSTLEFLQPEETIEKNTDSLRDFIISLDKSKADKLRYKVEDNIVRIFITPYKTSITQEDLEFSEGDFNVDVVVALGVRQQEDLDEAIVAHGRILHDATVASINTVPDAASLGSINWYDPQASSLSELVTSLAEALGPDLLDNQIATALLTGIVSETKRFSNDKTSSQTMRASATLMAAGANQQLVASKLEESQPGDSTDQPGAGDGDGPDQPDSPPPDASSDGGTLQIDHDSQPTEPPPSEPPLPPESENSPPPAPANFAPGPEPSGSASNLSPGAKLMTEPPSLGGTLTANSRQEGLDPTTDPFSLPNAEPPQLLDHRSGAFGSGAAASWPATPQSFTPPASTTPPALTPPPPSWTLPPDPSPTTPPPLPDDDHDQTLTELEQAVGDPHGKEEMVDSARHEVDEALLAGEAPDRPIEALNAQPLGGSLHADDNIDNSQISPSDNSQVSDPTAPPPVPPPIPFQFGNPPQNPSQ